MGIMRTNKSAKAIITSTPKGNNNFYDLYKMEKKLTIQNYQKDLGKGIFWGWDIISADEMDDAYLFQLKNRENNKLRIYITLGRELQESNKPSAEMFYQCYMHDDDGVWDKTVWLDSKSINYKTFWNMIESVVEEYHQTPLPF